MNCFHRMLAATTALGMTAVALLTATPAAAQEVALTLGADGDLLAAYDGEEPAEFVLMTATVDREGNVLDRTRGRTFVLKPGQDINVGRSSSLIGFGSFETLDPKPYTPDRNGLPGKKYFVTNLPGLLDGVESPRRGEVAAGPSGTGKTMDGSEGENFVNDPPIVTQKDTTVEPDTGEREIASGDEAKILRKRPGRTKTTDVFHIVTLVPADERVPRVNVQPVILHGAAPDDKPDW